MKILIYTDNHWTKYSSIVRQRGEKYSLRLENQINSLNYAEDLAKQLNCDEVFCLGDFFDKPELTSEEISALQEIKWADIPHYFLVGNHELGLNNREFNSAHLFELNANISVVDRVETRYVDNNSTQLVFLPYILEDGRKALKEYFTKDRERTIIFSHNDIKGVQMGRVVSTAGFEVEDIENNCELFLNGHLHNGTQITKKIINLGNVTGQNFSEDADKYPHCIYVLDTETLQVDAYENIYAFNFYKFDTVEYPELLVEYEFRNNAIVTAKAEELNYELTKEVLKNHPKVIQSRVILQPTIKVDKEEVVENFSINHLDYFRNYILESLGTSETVLEELNEVVK